MGLNSEVSPATHAFKPTLLIAPPYLPHAKNFIDAFILYIYKELNIIYIFLHKAYHFTGLLFDVIFEKRTEGKSMRKINLLGICSLLFLVCGNFFVAEASNPNTASAQSDHGESFSLGKVIIFGKEYEIHRLGKLTPGEEGAFEVLSGDDVKGISAYLWVESQDGKRLSAPSQSSFSNGKAHFHVLAQKDSKPFRIVLRIRQGDKDERSSLPLN